MHMRVGRGLAGDYVAVEYAPDKFAPEVYQRRIASPLRLLIGISGLGGRACYSLTGGASVCVSGARGVAACVVSLS